MRLLQWYQDEQGPSPVPITCPPSLVCAPGEGVYVQGHHAEHLKTRLMLSGEREEKEKLTVAGNLTKGPWLELPAL